MVEDNLKWQAFLKDLEEASKRLSNYEIRLTIKQSEPTYGEVRFTESNLDRFDKLKHYTGEYGFVVPIKASRDHKVLRGEKKLRYKNLFKNLTE